MARRKGERVLGPYAHHSGWLVVEFDAAGNRTSSVLPTEAKALRYKELLEAELNREDHTTATALEDYKTHLRDKGNRERSIETTLAAIRSFFPDAIPLALLSTKRCASLYDEYRTRPTQRTGKPPSADTHRNALSQVKTFLGWCVERGWLRENPAAQVKGIGKRRPRGLSLGKAGNELRVAQARAWYGMALFKANQGDEGAIGALVALLLGLRASEIVSRRVADLDTDRAAGDLLWIPCSKTPAGRRTLEVPEVLRELLVRCADGKAAERFLFESEPGKPHWRDWLRKNVARMCKLAEVPIVTAHAMRGLLATISAERGLAGHLIASTLGHEDERTTMRAYARPGAAATGANRRGLVVLNGGVQVERKVAK